MRNFHRNACVGILALAALLCFASDAQAQRKLAGTRPIITNARLDKSENSYYWPVYVTIGGKERKIASEAFNVWIIQGGQQVVYSGREGTGGFENEGQSLHIYDARTGKRRKIMSEFVMVDKVTDIRTASGRTALLVEMSDGGLGASYLAVVDPQRGEVFFRKWVKIVSRRGDRLTLAHYTMEDWYDMADNPKAAVKPYRIERQNLSAILKGRVIHNKPEYP